MNAEQRRTLRVAELIRRRVLAQEAYRSDGLATQGLNLAGSMSRYEKLCQMAARAHRRNWLAAGERLLEQAADALDDLYMKVQSQRNQCRQERQPICGLGDIFYELKQVEEEFGAWEFDPKDRTLAVKTEPIELEGIELGPFKIRLCLRDVGPAEPMEAFRVIALDPNPPTTRQDVTHPHVNDDRLCAGDAVNPIHAALETGRVCDFFMLVRSVLQTYNGQSAYVSLSEWSGTPCHDCGGIVHEDDRFYCERCDHDYCDACVSYCRQCEVSACMGCLEPCPKCQEPTCPDCMKTCNTCEEPCCAGCLTDGLCPACQKEQENNHEPEETEPNEAVGAGVPAGAPGQAA